MKTQNRPPSSRLRIETGLYYLQSRYYDPEIGRFINADALVTTGQGFIGNNMFAYCGNNPVMRIDPSGDLWWIIPVVVVALLLTGCSISEVDGPPYNSADDAATAFAIEVYSSSLYIRHEYATQIYSYTVNEVAQGTVLCVDNSAQGQGDGSLVS